MTAVRLLLVDDNRDNLDVLSLILSARYTVASFESAAEALAALDDARPDVLVLDIGMAPIDGLQCLQQIRARSGYAGIPAIALTAFARDVDREAFLAAGFQAVVTKPVLDDQQLVGVIDAVAAPPAPEQACAPTRGLQARSPTGVVRRRLTEHLDGGILSGRGRRRTSTPGPA
jgi:CheY-like chemotaxis protein